MDVEVPATTWFVPGLHTTTDEVQLFDTELLPESTSSQLRQLQQRFTNAGDRARAERAGSLDLDEFVDHSELLEAMLERANDWSQIRPEWASPATPPSSWRREGVPAT